MRWPLFYRSDEDWTQGEELPLEAMDPSQESCRDQALNTVISASQHQLIYVYDFFKPLDLFLLNSWKLVNRSQELPILI